MPKAKGVPPWSDDETAIVIYFISRGASHKVSSEVIKLKCDKERTVSTCSTRAKLVREKIIEMEQGNPVDDKQVYNRVIVDSYLSSLDIERGKLETLLALDAKTLEIMKKHV